MSLACTAMLPRSQLSFQQLLNISNVSAWSNVAKLALVPELLSAYTVQRLATNRANCDPEVDAKRFSKRC